MDGREPRRRAARSARRRGRWLAAAAGAAAAAALALAVALPGTAAHAQSGAQSLERYLDLYTVRVAAESAAGDLAPALASALRQVLVKVTGRRRLEESAGVVEALANPEGFVQQYFFESDPDFGLTVKFDEGAVHDLVERLGLGRWSRVRPLVLVWLVVEDGQGRKAYVGGGTPAAGALDAVAAERGVPFLLPLLDLEDRGALPVSALWGGFSESIRRASERYAPDAVLTGRAHRDEAGLWQVRWTLFADVGGAFGTLGESLEAALAEGVHRVADRFAERFARRGESAFAVPVAVHGVEALEDYARLVAYLSSIDVVERVRVDRVERSRVRLTLRVRGGLPVLAELVALGRTLEPLESGEEEGPPPGTAAAGGEEREQPAAVRYRLR